MLTQRTDFQQLQNFNNRETKLMLMFAEVQVTRTTLLKLARINIGSKFNSMFKKIPFALKYFPRHRHLHRLFPYPVLRLATACVTGHVIMTCLFSRVSTSRVSHHQLSHYHGLKVNRKCPGQCEAAHRPLDRADREADLIILLYYFRSVWHS